ETWPVGRAEVDSEAGDTRLVGRDDLHGERLARIGVEFAPGVVDLLDDGGVATGLRGSILESFNGRRVHQESLDAKEPVLIVPDGAADGRVDGTHERWGSPRGEVPMRNRLVRKRDSVLIRGVSAEYRPIADLESGAHRII